MHPLTPENFQHIKLSDLIRDPRFGAPARDLILTVKEKRGDLTLNEMADILDANVHDIIDAVVSQVVMAEVQRIVAEDEQRGELN